jgi:hypothetical protein
MQRLTKEDNSDVRPTPSTFRFLDFYLSVDLVVDALRFAFMCQPLVTLGGSFVRKIGYWRPVGAYLLEVDRRGVVGKSGWHVLSLSQSSGILARRHESEVKLEREVNT